MVSVNSTMTPLGSKAPHFSLPSVRGGIISLDNLKDKKGLLVMFICNHCPYVQHIQRGLVSLGNDYKNKDIFIVGINSNDWTSYPDDKPEAMKKIHASLGYTFPYLYDEAQSVAQAYKAACTPDFFLFDHNRQLVYRGQFDSSRPGNTIPVTGIDLRQAIDALLNDQVINLDQRPSIGCNIKWRKGNEPEYFKS